MKVIFDTNVLIAAFATHGFCHNLFEFVLENHEIVISNYILEQLQKKFSKKFKIPEPTIKSIMHFLQDSCTVSEYDNPKHQLCRDTNDDPILGIIVKTSVDYLVTGDKDLLVLKKIQTIPIVSPRELWEILKHY